MATFQVTYTIDIDEVGCPQEAAWEAWRIMRDPKITRAQFDVIEFDTDGRSELVTVDEDDDESAEQNKCRKCGAEYQDGGDGYDGLCPACADADEVSSDKSPECDCDDRSWHGAEHDSACPLAGTPRW